MKRGARFHEPALGVLMDDGSERCFVKGDELMLSEREFELVRAFVEPIKFVGAGDLSGPIVCCPKCHELWRKPPNVSNQKKTCGLCRDKQRAAVVGGIRRVG